MITINYSAACVIIGLQYCMCCVVLCCVVLCCVVLCCVQVYDVSGFIERHPGGVDQLMLGAGRDITSLFESYHDLNIYK